jgi:hypothetical protein
VNKKGLITRKTLKSMADITMKEMMTVMVSMMGPIELLAKDENMNDNEATHHMATKPNPKADKSRQSTSLSENT